MHPAIAQSLAQLGQLTVGQYMALANRLHDAGLAAKGELTAADSPNASDRILGTLLGLWAAEFAMQAGQQQIDLVAIGWRSHQATAVAQATMQDFSLGVTRSLIEPNMALHAHLKPAGAPSDFSMVSNFADLNSRRPSIFLALDWLDSFPTHQYVRIPGGWHEHVLLGRNDRLVSALYDTKAQHLAPLNLSRRNGNVLAEQSELRAIFCDQLATYLADFGGAACFTAFGQRGPVENFTVAARAECGAEQSLFDQPGEHRLTSLVSLDELTENGGQYGLETSLRPLPEWLAESGAGKLIMALTKLDPARRDELEEALARLAQPLAAGAGRHMMTYRTQREV